MAKINSSTYGSITIDNVTYNHDVFILPSGKVEEREYGHTFTKEQVEHILPDYNPPSSSSHSPKGERAPKEIEIIEAHTPEIKDKFNQLAETKRVAAIIHVTC